MKASGRELKYAEAHFHEVHHTTLNPEGPGVVRIHLIPPVIRGKEIAPSVAIINGQDIIPVNVSWSILLTELIEEINRYAGREITQEEADRIVEDTCAAVKKVYPFVGKARLRQDIGTIMETFTQIAYHEPVAEDIGYMSIGDYAPYMKAPHRMDLLVSAMTKSGRWNCTQKCIHCYAAGQSGAEEEELPTEAWKEILGHLREIGVPQVTFTGGEPTMREDLIELIDSAQWFVTRLNTNGMKLTPDYCRRLFEASLDSIQITFYSANADIHNRLVGAQGYQKTVEGIGNALQAGLSVSINTPLCTLNRDYKETLKFLHGMGVQYVTCSGLITTGNAILPASENLQLSIPELQDILREAVAFCHENGMEISFTSPGWLEDSFFDELGITTPNCGACLSNMAITPSGHVVPCQSWLSDAPLGDFRKDSWEEIWNSEACRRRRDYSAAMLCDCPLKNARQDEKNRKEAEQA